MVAGRSCPGDRGCRVPCSEGGQVRKALGIACVGEVIEAGVKDACLKEGMQRRGSWDWRVNGIEMSPPPLTS